MIFWPFVFLAVAIYCMIAFLGLFFINSESEKIENYKEGPHSSKYTKRELRIFYWMALIPGVNHLLFGIFLVALLWGFAIALFRIVRDHLKDLWQRLQE